MASYACLAVCVALSLMPSSNKLVSSAVALSLMNSIEIQSLQEYIEMLYSWSFFYQAQISNLDSCSRHFGRWEDMWEILFTYLPMFNYLKEKVYAGVVMDERGARQNRTQHSAHRSEDQGIP